VWGAGRKHTGPERTHPCALLGLPGTCSHRATAESAPPLCVWLQQINHKVTAMLFECQPSGTSSTSHSQGPGALATSLRALPRTSRSSEQLLNWYQCEHQQSQDISDAHTSRHPDSCRTSNYQTSPGSVKEGLTHHCTAFLHKT
jgi:hypothetical protein